MILTQLRSSLRKTEIDKIIPIRLGFGLRKIEVND